MALDLILRHARLASVGLEQPAVDIGVQHGRIVAIEPHLTAEGPAYDAGGKLVSVLRAIFTLIRHSRIACRSAQPDGP
jgi:hypothetical protein